MLLWTSFLVGLVGSVHCIGMCGPISFALSQDKGKQLLVKRMVYNIGRITTYTLMGCIFGLLGMSFSMAGMQQWVSLALGIIIILYLILPSKYFLFLERFSFTRNANIWIKLRFANLFKNKTFSGQYMIGVLNGLLPCGLVYVALAAAIASGSYWKGMLNMAMFGFGTLPLMFIFSLTSNFVNISFRKKLTRLIPAFLFTLAVLFILRGLNLGIPYLSPEINYTTDIRDVTLCH